MTTIERVPAEGLGLFDLIARIRRNMPRNKEVLALADYAESFYKKCQENVKPATKRGRKKSEAGDGFDKVAYMRGYMQKRRAAEKRKRDAKKRKGKRKAA